MGIFDETAVASYTEPVPATPVFCTGLATAYLSGGVMHFCFYVEQELFTGERTTTSEKIINLRLIMPIDGVRAGVQRTIQKLSRVGPTGLIIPEPGDGGHH